jgi:hypothetical protein
VGALFMMWPALFNRYPLLYADSMTYIEDGGPVARALFLHKFSEYYGFRSLLYSLGILPFHWNVTPWPVVALQALLAAYVIWLIVRSILPRQTVLCYLGLCLLLSLLTTLSWFASLIMPDILGPLLYLSIYLLVFARETLSLVERLIIIVIAWWAITSHTSHLLVVFALWVLLALLKVVWRKSTRFQWRAIGEVGAIILLAAGAQVAVNDYLYDEPSLDAEHPPFLTARIIVDGPGRLFLEQHCGEVKFAICEDVHNLPDSTDSFLWDSNGIWANASDEKQVQLRQQEIPFFLATLRAYPRDQISKSAANFWNQLTTFGIEDLGSSDWVLKQFDTVLPSGRSRYVQSPQGRDALAFDFFMFIQKWTVIASLIVFATFALYLWRHRPPRIRGLAGVISFTIVFNAFVTGVLSGPEERYQARVIWLLPLLACVLLLDWRQRLKSGERSIQK